MLRIEKESRRYDLVHLCIARFVKMEDRKRALVSRLLQYALVHQVLGIPYDEIVIKRTLEGKPFLVRSNIAILFLLCTNDVVLKIGEI